MSNRKIMPAPRNLNTTNTTWSFTTSSPEKMSISIKIEPEQIINILIHHSDRYSIFRSQKEIIRLLTIALQEMGDTILENLEENNKED